MAEQLDLEAMRKDATAALAFLHSRLGADEEAPRWAHDILALIDELDQARRDLEQAQGNAQSAEESASMFATEVTQLKAELAAAEERAKRAEEYAESGASLRLRLNNERNRLATENERLREELVGANWIIEKLVPHETMAVLVRGWRPDPADVETGAKYRAYIDATPQTATNAPTGTPGSFDDCVLMAMADRLRRGSPSDTVDYLRSILACVQPTANQQTATNAPTATDTGEK